MSTTRNAPADPALVLLAHDRWATSMLFDACATLSDAQLDTEFPMGLGTLRKTLTHIVGAMRGWTDMLNGHDRTRPRLEEGGPLSIGRLRAVHAEAADALEKAAREERYANVAKAVRGGQEYAFSRGGVLTHVTTHAMHHRAQCLNMLRTLGVEPVPNPSVLAWMIEHPSV